MVKHGTCFATICSISILLLEHVRCQSCPMEYGYPVTSPSDDFCATAKITCEADTEFWSIENCGCGCKPKCVAAGNTLVSNQDGICTTLEISCPTDYESWTTKGCGCGCKPESSNANSVFAADDPCVIPDGASWHPPSLCDGLVIQCPSNQEKWEIAGCGCGCVDKEDIDSEKTENSVSSDSDDNHDIPATSTQVASGMAEEAATLHHDFGIDQPENDLNEKPHLDPRVMESLLWIMMCGLAVIAMTTSLFFLANGILLRPWLRYSTKAKVVDKEHLVMVEDSDSTDYSSDL